MQNIIFYFLFHLVVKYDPDVLCLSQRIWAEVNEMIMASVKLCICTKCCLSLCKHTIFRLTCHSFLPQTGDVISCLPQESPPSGGERDEHFPLPV